MRSDNLLIVGSTEQNADLLYALGVLLARPLLYLRLKGGCLALAEEAELPRLQKLAPHCRVSPIEAWRERQKRRRDGLSGWARIIQAVLREQGVRKVMVPAGFPYGLARELRRLAIKTKVCRGAVFPQREIKSSEELKKISAAVIMAEIGMAEGLQALKNSRPDRNRKLYYRNAPLTAERLRNVIQTAIFQAGGFPVRAVVAGGRQAADSLAEGHGPLRAQEPIILSCSPRSQKTGYFGVIARTVVKGRASEAARRLYHVVARSQCIALENLGHGRAARDVHRRVNDFFLEQGFRTTHQNGGRQGFYGDTGHGLGLELEEPPRISAESSDMLSRGQVVVIEPCLYYPEIGGARLADVFQINSRRPRRLSQFEKILEI